MRLLVLALVVVACGKREVSQHDACAEAARKSVAALGTRAASPASKQALEALAPRLRAVIENRCVDDKWPRAVIDCHAKATAIDEMRACREQLPVAQQDRFEREQLELMTDRGGGPPGFRQAPRPSSPEIDKLQAELAALNQQLVAAVTAVKEAITQADRDTAIAKHAEIEKQMRDVNDKLAALRAQQPR